MAEPAPTRPLPAPTPTSAPYWEALRREELHLQRCARCAHWVHYPRVRCPNCFSADLGWHRADPIGTIWPPTSASVQIARTSVHAPFVTRTGGAPSTRTESRLRWKS